jgi:hypothetical protein
MKRVLIVAILLTAATACGSTEPESVPIPTIGTSDTTTTDTTPPPTTTTTTTSTTPPPPAAPATEVPDVAPPAQPAPYTPPVQPPPAAPAEAYYANCSEARAAGAAPLHRGEPGYRSGLDRDDDGVACET